MAIGQHVAGPYNGTYGGGNLNHTTNGFELDFESKLQEINESDLFGDSLIEMIRRGGQISIIFEAKVYGGSPGPAGSGVLGAFWPWGVLGTFGSTASPIGGLASAIQQALTLTAVPNTSAANNPNTVSGFSVLAPGSQRLLFTSKVRVVPIKLVFLPTYNSGNLSFASFS